ncbi:hypothetical protein F7725_026607, partial [Dissostichus mawsoni]
FDLSPTQQDVFEAAWGFISPVRRISNPAAAVHLSPSRCPQGPVVLLTVSLVPGAPEVEGVESLQSSSLVQGLMSLEQTLPTLEGLRVDFLQDVPLAVQKLPEGQHQKGKGKLGEHFPLHTCQKTCGWELLDERGERSDRASGPLGGISCPWSARGLRLRLSSPCSPLPWSSWLRRQGLVLMERTLVTLDGVRVELLHDVPPATQKPPEA